MKRVASIVLAALVLAGCTQQMSDILEGPKLSPVGSGLVAADAAATASVSRASDPADADSGWQGGPADYFRDYRASRRGDILTVEIDVNDKATFNNSSNRARKSSAGADTSFDVGLFSLVGQGAGEAAVSANSSASGQGSVVRSEKLTSSLSAIVTDVLPNGNLVIEGSQEILVNNERRDLRIAGVVDPRYITTENTIPYTKIAEARVYYGGAGRVSDVQRPGWGLQLWDKISPF